MDHCFFQALCLLCLSAVTLGQHLSSRNGQDALKNRQKRNVNCCGELGCFDVDGPFLDILKRPINPFPSCGTKVKLSLTTQDNVAKPEILDPNDSFSVESSHFRADREGTKILVHGFLESKNVRWMALMEPKLLLQGDFNVIRVDWSSGADVTYFQAAANTRVVGATVALLIRILTTEFGEDLAKIHIIGHSLGAHIAGYAGKRAKVGRITGLDPAGLYFKDMPPAVRLDPGDAQLVETVVTDGRDLMQLGYGTLQPMGHINFYPNGGRDQPGCGKSFISSLLSLDISGASSDALGCSHFRAPILYADTIANPTCTFAAVECQSYEMFRAGKCFSCGDDKCPKFGLDADIAPVSSGSQKMFFFLTGDSTPFCAFLYRVSIKLAANSRTRETGMMKVQLHGQTKSSNWIDFGPEAIEFQAGMTYACVVSVPEDFGRVKTVHLTWSFDYSLLHPFAWLSTHTLYLEPTMEVTLLHSPSVQMKTEDVELNEKQTSVFVL